MEASVDQDQKWLVECLTAALDTNSEIRSFAEASLKQASLQLVHGALRCLALLSSDLDDTVVPKLVPSLFPHLHTIISSPHLCELSFKKTHHLRNPYNDNLPVKISRDCQELEPFIGEQLASLLYLEPDSELMISILRASFPQEIFSFSFGGSSGNLLAAGSNAQDGYFVCANIYEPTYTLQERTTKLKAIYML